MKEYPIIFSGSMVTAILEGRKTITRRPLKKQPSDNTTRVVLIGNKWCFFGGISGDIHYLDFDQKCPYGIPGDRLWVRETYLLHNQENKIWYKADGEPPANDWDHRWQPSIFMPQKYSRIILEITNIRVEKLQEIMEEDAKKEGMNFSQTVEMGDGSKCYTLPFQVVWEGLYGIDNSNAWEKNPWVWVIEFKSKQGAGQG